MVTGALLLALLMTGMPLFALFGSNGVDDDPQDPAGQLPDEPPGDAASGGGASPGPEDMLEDGEPPPTDYEFILDTGGDHRIEGFRPGTDTLTLTVADWDFELYDVASGEAGPALRIDRNHMSAFIRFPELTVLPVEDIHLRILGPGGEFQRLALIDALYPEDREPAPLLPRDPDETDAPPDDAPPGVPLAPAGPEDLEPPPDPAEGTVLLPSDPEAP